MASTIASLFGPSAEEIVYERQKEERDRQAQQYQTTLSGLRDVPGVATGYAAGYQGGQGLGQALGGLFGQSSELEDPRIAKALQIRQAFQGMSAADMSNPGKLQELAEKLQASGNPEAAMQLSSMAASAKAAEAAAIPDVANPTRFRLPDGSIVNGGFQNGRPVAYMDDGTLVAIQGDYTEVGEGVTATEQQTLQTGPLLETLGIEWDAGLQAKVAGRAAALLKLDPNVNDYPAAVALIAEQMFGTGDPKPKSVEQVDYKELGLPRPADNRTGEKLRVNKDGTVSIISVDGQVLHTGNQRLPDELLAEYAEEGKRRQARDETIAGAIPEPLTAEREQMLREQQNKRPKSRGIFTSTEEAAWDYKQKQKNRKQ